MKMKKSLVMPSIASMDEEIRSVSCEDFEEEEETLEESILSIGSSMTPLEFRDSVDNALRLAVPDIRHSLVLLLDLETNELAYFNSDDSCQPMPKQGMVWEAVRRRVPGWSQTSIPEDDPIHGLLPNLGPLVDKEVVLLNPIVEKKDNKVVALLIAVCNEPSQERIHWLEKNVLVAASRVLKHTAAEKGKRRAESMLDVCGDLIDLDTACLTIKILKHLKQILEVKMCYMFILDDSTQELVCQVFNEVPVDNEIRLPISSHSLYGHCFTTGETIVIKNISKDMRFNPAVDIVNGYEPTMMICMPMKVPMKVQQEDGSEQEFIAVAVACDKINGKMFSTRDRENMRFVLRFSSSVLDNTLAFQRELNLKKQNQVLLQIAKNLFSNLSDLEHLLQQIMNAARSLINAEQCSVFLLDQHTGELVAKVFDGGLPDKQKTISIKVGQGIAGYVAETGTVVNISDAYQHPKFFQAVDKNTGFHTKNILCFPIMLEQEIVGVAQLCNKINGKFFTKYDEELATTFSVYCGISLYQTRLYAKMEESQSRSHLANEIMLYHMDVSAEETGALAQAEIPPCSQWDPQFSRLTYYPSNVEDSDSVMAVMSMMNEMNLINKWRLDQSILASFIVRVKKGYRNPPYHNWDHAFSVSHYCYSLFKNCSSLDLLDDIEILALFVSCMCHDIDHRGTNNVFQVRSNSTLASLYSSEGSVLERHHFAQAVSILTSKGCGLFDHLTPTNYRRMLDLMQQIILATDIADHLRKMKDITKMAKDGYDRSNSTHHQLLCSVLMTACDLCFNTKSWEVSEELSSLLYREFFTQGDLEKALGETPLEMMDKDKAYIPAQQVGFLNGIAGPVYEVLSQLLPGMKYSYESFEANKAKWTELSKEGEPPSPEPD
ncbi:cGMP-dependent 3',5'-cyclic phosphodiesterase-like isoform X2 [Halichondria panicea]|uniref:cGMP-dependent 3',5'-cyclic phosphodiesterase-like isoform X2 n=1 Tax=Halichondria panicea TaxID=6063 RepID=UPI00312B59AA